MARQKGVTPATIFSATVRSALEHIADPLWLGRHSPLAMPYFLGRRVREENYPTSERERGLLLQAAIRRNRATQDVSYARAALIKACLNRSNRYYHKSERELQMGLDPENTNIGYNLGRLFAVFEKVQYRAIQAKTVKNFFGGASSCPASAFPTLKRLNKYHMNKLEKDAKGAFYFYRALLEDIYANFNDPNNEPKILSLTDQGIFSVGYYHQLHALRYNPKAQEVDPLTEEEKEAA